MNYGSLTTRELLGQVDVCTSASKEQELADRLCQALDLISDVANGVDAEDTAESTAKDFLAQQGF